MKLTGFKNLWRSQGCRSRVAVLDPKDVDLQVKRVKATGYIIELIIKYELRTLVSWQLDVVSSASDR